MNFFNSILSDDPEPPKSKIPHDSESISPSELLYDDQNPDDVAQDDIAGLWSFEGLIKTLATRSESVIETYRRDLKEFGSGLKTETEIFREAASRAVKDIPTSIKSTADLISKEVLIFSSEGEPQTPETNRSLNSARYSWFESQLSAIQSDLSTFSEEPEDAEEYKKWKSGFELEDKRGEIEGLIGENGTLKGVYKRIVPSEVDHETFLCRYFYRVDKLEQQERVRANLVRRATSFDEEELSWDIDDEDEDNQTNGGIDDMGMSDGSLNSVEKQESSNQIDNDKEGGVLNVDIGDNNNVVEESSKKSNEHVSLGEKEVQSEDVAQMNSDEKVKSEQSVEDKIDEKVDKGESGTKGDTAAMSSHQSKVEDEDDMGWDEIEDIGSGEEKRIGSANDGSPNRAELRKRLVAAEDDEDLNWDIEDDDEPVKA
ncbi:hypothetical protein ACJIZ3_011711 [Penstemon smallii]|uniref:BSD domain-containing protein n=1 Tax=Penstemon smallii TaxID=265156 RepID=A0ABD3UJW6_9LAMI